MPLLKRTHKIPSNRINTQLLMSSCIDNVLPFHFHRDSLFSFEFPCPSNSGEFHFSCRLTSRSCAPARSPTRQFWLELRAMPFPTMLCFTAGSRVPHQNCRFRHFPELLPASRLENSFDDFARMHLIERFPPFCQGRHAI